jgi:glutamate/tyrosine decarboxylase-like PLP-dependent enzyme
MTAPYQNIVSALRQAFPQPLSSRAGDANLASSLLRALDRVDAVKSARPMLGSPEELDYAGARRARIGEDPLPLEQVTDRLVEYLAGLFIWGHPRTQINIDPVSAIPSIVGELLSSIYNPNLVSDESSKRVSIAEIEAASLAAALVGYDPEHSGGVFTFGGTATTLYGVKIGLEKALPGTMHAGLRGPAYVVCSEQAHYAAATVAGWLGLGLDQIVEVPSDRQNAIRTCLCETICRDLVRRGKRIAGIIATLGTTDAFGLDDLKEICAVRDRLVDEFSLDYVPHVHADAVIGWAWSVFNDYDFETNALGFRGRTLRALAAVHGAIEHLHLADSIGIDFHKTGFAPYTSSLCLVRDERDLSRIARDARATSYLFQAGHYNPGQFTLETSRSGSGPLAALANLLLFGKNGLRALLGHLVAMAEALRERLEAQAATRVLNCGNFGPVTLFRVYPDGVDALRFAERERADPECRDVVRQYNAYNRRLFELIQAEAIQGRGVAISMSDCYRRTDYGEPIAALKSYIMSPFTEERHVDELLQSLFRARESLEFRL